MLRISKLVPDDQIVRTAIVNNSLNSLDKRMTGQTTGVALASIGVAMQNPDEEVYLGRAGSRETNELLRIVRDKIKELKLEHLRITHERGIMSLVYNVYR